MSDGAPGLELCYLGRLEVRLEAGRPLVDLGFIYGSENLLAHRLWPSYTRTCAENAARVRALFEPSAAAGPWTAELAIFTAEDWPALRPLIATDDGRLIAWKSGEIAALRVGYEREHALAMWALIKQARAEKDDQ
jgi:hypothetical protein